MKLADLGAAALHDLLRRGTLTLHTPPFVVRLRSDIARVGDDLLHLYPNFELADEAGFADFHLEVNRVPGLRRWMKPMARFGSDGEAAFSTLPAEQAFHMIEWGLNWAVTSSAHHFLLYHAAVLERDGMALMLPAPPGSGKSTLAAALAHRGWRLLSDELALYNPRSRLVQGMARPVNLKNAAISLIREFAPDAVMTAPVPDTAKGTLALMRAPGDSVARVLEPARPAWIVMPRYVAGSSPLLVPMAKARMLLLLAEQAFNYEVHGRDGFNATGDLVDACSCHEFSYSRLDDAVHAIDALAALPS